MCEEIDFDRLTANLIRMIGDTVSEKKMPISALSGIGATIGAPNDEIASILLEDLVGYDVIKVGSITKLRAGTIFSQVDLARAGWEKYHAVMADVNHQSDPYEICESHTKSISDFLIRLRLRSWEEARGVLLDRIAKVPAFSTWRLRDFEM